MWFANQNASFAAMWLKLGTKVDLHVKVAESFFLHTFSPFYFA